MRRSARRPGKDPENSGGQEETPGFRRRPGKEQVVGDSSPLVCPDERLPKRLFETDRFPSRRLNNYSSLGYLMVVRDALKGTPDLGRLLRSCFGPLFNIPVRRCSYSSVMLHAMLARQVVTKKKYELWPVFGGNPFRFSLVEYGRVTGLPCGEFEEGYAVDVVPKYKEADYAFWDYLFDGRRDITIAEVAKMIEQDLTIPRSRRFRLCLILIVDGVLLASTSPVCPTLKHVKRLENLNKFLEFPWGRESFYWTISTMIPPKRVMGLCDDPEGDFCSSLRQKTKKMSGFPLALQLVVYELIPVLSGRLGGTDEVKIIDCEALPQRKGLKLWDVLEAENDPQLMVEPMMDVPGDMPEGWGVWDDEIADRTVAYMVRRLCGGQQFLKSAWRGGDAQEDFYNHEDAKALRKRKREAGAAKTGVIAEPLLVQRRLSAYFRKPALVDNVSNGEVVSRLVALEKTVTWLKRKLSKRRRLGLTPRKELMRSGKKLKMKESGISKGRKSEDVSEDDEDEQVGDPDDVGPEYRGEGDTDDEGDGSGERDDGRRFSDDDFMEEDGGIDGNKDNERTPPPEIDNDVNNENVGGSEKVNEDSHVSGEASESENEVAETEEAGGGDIAGAGGVDSSSSSAEPPPVLLPLAEGDGVPLQWVEKGATGLDGTVLYRATTSQTYYVADEVVDDGSGSVKKDEQVSNSEAVDGDEHETSRLDELIGNIVTQGCGTEVVLDHEGGKNEPEQEKAEAAKGVNDMPAHVREECCGGEDAAVEEVGGGAVGPDGLKNVLDDKAVTCISDSPSKLRARHKPVEAEADLAALLLAKEPFRLEKIVPFELDPDYVFFEQVLLSGPKVTHMGLPVCDMDNQFFLDLAASQKWVTSKHMEVLMYYVGERHAELFKLRRVMFVAPWFMEQLGGKAEAFASSRYKGRVFSDRKLAGYLTRVGQKLGVDVDEVFAPMIWGGNHWVGLRISITGWNVLVYDPDRTLRKMEEVMSLMTQIAQMLPYVVRKVCGAGYLKAHGLEPFSVSLMADGYQNTRSGDCGPVAVKFMELAATGVEEPDVKDITDGAVDCFRKQWAMDLYKDWIVPLYICGDGEHEDGGA